MKRLLLRLVVATVMLAMVLAMAAQAFAAPPTTAGGSGGCNEYEGITYCGGSGGMQKAEGSFLEPCDPTVQTCSGTLTSSGGGGTHDSEGGSVGYGGHSIQSGTAILNPEDPEYPVSDDSLSSQGGNSLDGGGNCWYDFGLDTGFDGGGNGPRCELFEPQP